MSSPAPTPGPPTATAPLRRLPSPSAYWRGWPEVRADLRTCSGLALALALTGVPLGLLWWLLAPRADFRITADGPVVIGTPPAELLVADDAVFALVFAVAGVLMGAAAWRLRRRRGVATVVALPLGAALAGVIAWQLGEYLGAGPGAAELEAVGSTVTTALRLGSPPALAVAPFTALAAYLVGVLYAAGDDLGRADAVRPAVDPDRPADEPAPAPV
ncbi:MAG: hypothetical protein AVDCRST_MAG57-1733 [uncultured Blastococcus sp.]|uniref:DUF2567 domain-containing protein n=1 Tax=uncultured Blastococcus sp. TaxID=217144 RepID=A0A6J4IBS8_9ACTN|nr:MAG: hypothetical protein AVDCRST_MAG57-1733 [uncultured Blastococcus sp.]